MDLKHFYLDFWVSLKSVFLTAAAVLTAKDSGAICWPLLNTAAPGTSGPAYLNFQTQDQVFSVQQSATSVFPVFPACSRAHLIPSKCSCAHHVTFRCPPLAYGAALSLGRGGRRWSLAVPGFCLALLGDGSGPSAGI